MEGTDAQLSSEALESMAGVAVAQTENNARVTAATENMTGKINVEVDMKEINWRPKTLAIFDCTLYPSFSSAMLVAFEKDGHLTPAGQYLGGVER